MGVITKLANINKYETGANYELGNSVSSSSVANMFGSGGDAINVLEEYNGFAWKCINIRAEMLADQDLFVERMVNNKWVEDKLHPFNEVLEGGVGQLDQSELLENHEKSMCLYGESFWYYSKGESSSKPMSVYLLDPNAMTVYVKDNRVQGYRYQKGTVNVLLDLGEIDHYRYSHPRNQFRGYSPMQAAGWFIRSARYVNTYVNNFLENNAMPAGVIVSKDEGDDDDWALFKRQWAENYSGINNSGKTGFIRGTDVSFVKTGLSLGEVDFEKIKNTSRDDVMIMFGISKPMMAIFDDINRASAVTARQLFAITLTSPSLRRLRRKMSKNVAHWYGKQYRIGSTNPIPEDAETKLAQYDKGVGRWVTINEARAAYGLEPIKGGDLIQPEVAPKPDNQPAKSYISPKKLGSIKVTTKNNKADFSYEMKESFRSETQSIQEKHEAKLIEAISTLMKAQKADVLEQLKPKKVVDAKIDLSKEAEKLTIESIPIIFDLAREQGQLATELVGSKEAVFTLTNVMEQYVKDSFAKSALSFTTETRDKVSQALIDGLNNGESINTIGKRVTAIYDDLIGRGKVAGFRTERLVRTEVIKTSNEITEAAYKQSQVVQKKEWFANPGHCEFCASLNGSVITLGATYVPVNDIIEGKDPKTGKLTGNTRANSYENVKHPPVHSNCRCTLIPVIEELN